MIRRLAVSCPILVALWCGPLIAQEPNWVRVDLGTLGGSWSVASAINNGGMVVGRSSVLSDTATHAFAWTQAAEVPLLLGQVNFFMEFDVCFFRAQAAFEIKPKIVRR